MKHDVIVVGAGLAGLTAAVGLAAQRRRVLVLDARAAATPARRSSAFDQRVYAISPASVAWLTSIRVWQSVDARRITPVYDMRIHGDADAGSEAADEPAFLLPRAGQGLHLSAYRAGVAELCHIVEECELMRIAEGAAGFMHDIEVLRSSQPIALQAKEESIAVTLADGRTFEAGLVVGADGARSWVRAAAGIDVTETPYGQSAVVANFHAEKPHFNCATQWFRNEMNAETAQHADADSGYARGNAAGTASGVLAWLPLPEQHVSMVWSAPDALAAELAAMAPDALAAHVAAAGGGLLGAFRTVGAAATFPLRNLQAARTIASRVALVGDAAHVVHPLMGQGLNLGFGDCAALVDALSGAPDPGDALVLRRYARARKAAVAEMHLLTHGLQRLFAARHPALRTLRNLGLNLSAQLPVIPELLVGRATRTIQ